MTAISAVFVVGTATAGTSAPAERVFAFGPGSTVVIAGTSNVRKWTCATSTFSGRGEMPDSSAANVGAALTALVVIVPVQSLDCGNGSMNGSLRKAMHADQFPTIRYRMTSYAVTPHGRGYAGVMQGVLTINGVDRPSELHVTTSPDSGGATVVGTAAVTTTDFGVNRVSILFGAVRTSADVTITFRLAIRQP